MRVLQVSHEKILGSPTNFITLGFVAGDEPLSDNEIMQEARIRYFLNSHTPASAANELWEFHRSVVDASMISFLWTAGTSWIHIQPTEEDLKYWSSLLLGHCVFQIVDIDEWREAFHPREGGR